MKKSLKAALAFALALVIIPTSISAPAQAAVTTVACSGGGTFTVDGTQVTGSTNTCAGEVVIPANVTRIDFFAFENRSLITSARFEAGSQLGSISNWAFQNSGLTSIDLPDGMWELGYQAFRGAKLTSISIPGTVTSIGNETLSMSTLETVVFETRIASGLGVDANAFKNSLNLQSVTWTGGKTNNWGRGNITKAGFRWSGWSTEIGGAIVADAYPMPSAGITLYPNWRPDSIIQIPCSLGGTFRSYNETVDQSTADCAGAVVIPAYVERINGSVFANRAGLTSVSFEEGSQVQSITNWTFQNSGLTSIDLPDSVWELGMEAFKNSKLTSISIPGKVRSIGSSTFEIATLETVVFETRTENTLNIDGNWLRNAVNLESITWTGGRTYNLQNTPIEKPEHVWLGWSTEIGGPLVSSPFTLITQGVTVYPNWKPDDITEFSCSLAGTFKTRNETLESSTADCAGEVTIPAFVTKIGRDAFSTRAITNVIFEAESQLKTIENRSFQKTKFTSIDLPDGLDKIYKDAFNQSALTSISIPGTLTYLEWASFNGSSRLETVTFERRIAGTLNAEYDALETLVRLRSVTYVGPIQLNSFFLARKGANEYLGWSSSLDGPLVTFPVTVGEAGMTFYPKHNPVTSNAFFNSAGGTPVATGTVVGGEIQYPEPPTRAGYSFRGWSDPGWYPNYVPIDFWASNNDVTLIAIWNPNTNDLNFDSKGGTTVASSTFLTGSRIESAPEAPTRAGYTFGGWSEEVNGNVIGFPYSPSATDDLTLYAKWTANRHDVNFDTKGGSFREPISFFTDGQIEVSPSAPDRPGYTLDGWAATDNGSVLEFPYSPGVIGAITLYAVWTANTYVVTFDSKDGSSVPSTTYVTDGQMSSTPEEPIRLGYTFEGWSPIDGGSVVLLPYSPGVIGDITLYAVWSRQFVINFESNGGSAVADGYFKEFGSLNAAPTAPTRRGYTFAGWSATNGGTAISFPYAPGVSEDINLYALWTVNIYTITFNPNGGVAVPNGSFTIETDAQLVTPIRVGYTFNGWSATDGGAIIAFPYAPGVVENITLYAKWTRNPYKPELLSNPTVSGDGYQSTYMVADLGTWSAFPDAVLTVQWYRCDKSVSAGLSTIPAASKCVKIAGATKTKYKLVVADAGEYMTVLVQAKNSIGTTLVTAKSDRALPLKAPAKVKLPVVEGTAVAKQTLTVDDGTFSANPVAKISIQWFRCEDDTKVSGLPVPDSAQCEEIKGAKGARYRLVTADEGKYITAQIEAENSEGNAFTTAKSVRVALTPSVIANPDVSGSAQIGKVVSASAGRWLAFPAADTSVQWFRCNKETLAGARKFGASSGCVAIKGATKARYTLAAADRGKHISALVTAENKAGDETVTTDSQQVSFEPVNTTDPRISGTATVGRTLESTSGGWTAFPEENISFAWYRCAKPTVSGSESFARASGCAAIGGANNSSYTLSAADSGKHVSVLVRARNSAGSNTVTARSTAQVTQEPTKTANPAISGSATVGRTLNATPGGWAAFPEERSTFTWYRCDNPTSAGSESFDRASGCVAIGGATNSRYTVKEADIDKYLSVLVKAANSAGSSTVTARSTAKVG